MFGNRSKGIVEAKDIQFITEQERNKKSSSQFYLWFASNLTIADLALGSLIYTIQIPMFWFLISAAVGNILGGGMLAIMSVMGPKTGLPQMMIGRRSFGDTGGRVIAGLQWLNSIGWFIFNSIIAASAVAILIFGLGNNAQIHIGGVSLGIWNYLIPVVIVCLAVAFLAYMGDRIIHAFERVMSLVLAVMFIIIVYYVVANFGFPSPGAGSALPTALFGISLALTFSYIMSWGPYAADYSRYVKSESSSRSVFLFTLTGAVIASFFVEIIGFLIAAHTSEAKYISIQTFNLLSPLGLGVFGMITLFLGGLSANALNLYSNSLSLKSIGSRISRRTFVVIIVVIAIIVSYIGYPSYYVDYEDFLILLDYWITPWLGVMIADFFIVGRFFRKGDAKRKTGAVAVLSYVLSIIISIPFMNPGSVFVGPIANFLGGVDISYYISFTLAIALYLALYRFAPALKADQRK